MIDSQHATSEELRHFIHSTEESESIQRLGEHVHQCPQCRNALEAMTAQSKIWNQAPVLLNGGLLKKVDGKGMASKGSLGQRMQDLSRTSEQPYSDGDSHGPVTSFLDRPSHPEMLGRIGKYDIESEIGRGGMGVVFKGYDAELNRPVAIKVLAPHLASHGTARRRFAQEAMAAGGILHPNVIPVYGVNHEAKNPFIVMPFVDGPSLQALVDQKGPLSEIEITRVALQIAYGLAAAHAQGLVHRDIKPANILVDGGVHRVMITDFGLARAEDDASLTRSGWLMGTPNYMSPEQTQGRRADHRSDLFSLGSLIYFLASGRLPFRSESALGVLHRIQHDQPTPIRQVNPLISATLAAVINKLLKKDPEARFPSAVALHELLEQHLAYLYQPDATKPPKVPASHFLQRFEKPGMAMAMVFFLVGGIAALNNSPWSSWTARTPEAKAPTLLAEPLSATSLKLNQDATAPSPSEKEPVNSISLASDSQPPISRDSVESRAAEAPNAHEEPPKSTDLLEEDPDAIGEALYVEAEKLREQGRYQESLATFVRATEYPCARAESHYNIACLRVREGEADQAFASLQQAIEWGFIDEQHYRIDPDLKALRNDERFDKLLSRIKELSHAERLIAQAKRESAKGDYAAAEKVYREALSIHPNHEDAILHLGYAIHMQGRIEDALPWHERASQSANCQGLGHYNMACVHALKGDTDQAFQHLNQAIRFKVTHNLSVEQIKKDSDLESLREDARFAMAMEELAKLERKRRATK